MTEHEPGAVPEERPGEDTGADSKATPAQSGTQTPPPCDLCGSAMLELHCKLVCTNCGYIRDCSDP